MREQILDHYEGSGQLRDGDGGIVPVDYQLAHSQMVIDDGLGGEVPTLETIGGVVSTDGELDLYPLIQSTVVLILKDGRQLKVVLKEIRPNGTAEIQANGGFIE